MTKGRARAQMRRRMPRHVVAGIATLVVIAMGIAAGCGSSSKSPAQQTGAGNGSEKTGPMGPEGIALEQGPPLASASTAASGETVDGIRCESSEQVAYHLHAHLAVYVNGTLRPIPAGIGIVEPMAQQTSEGVFMSASRCYYWLHVHADDGVIHVESPNHTTYTLGQFFAIWRQPLTRDQVGPARGAVTAYVNGSRYSGDPAAIELKGHTAIQLSVGNPVVPPKQVDWSNSQL